jgi:hypothetical protein
LRVPNAAVARLAQPGPVVIPGDVSARAVVPLFANLAALMFGARRLALEWPSVVAHRSSPSVTGVNVARRRTTGTVLTDEYVAPLPAQ